MKQLTTTTAAGSTASKADQDLRYSYVLALLCKKAPCKTTGRNGIRNKDIRKAVFERFGKGVSSVTIARARVELAELASAALTNEHMVSPLPAQTEFVEEEVSENKLDNPSPSEVISSAPVIPDQSRMIYLSSNSSTEKLRVAVRLIKEAVLDVTELTLVINEDGSNTLRNIKYKADRELTFT